MSSQRGNTKRTRPQKYQNKTAFKNDLHDTSKRTRQINNLEISEVCKQCKEVIEWKIKYKKYKPLTQPKTCSNCHQKTIKLAYHVLCEPCAKGLKVCPKCHQTKELELPKSANKTKEDLLAEMEDEINLLPERKRRTLYRYIDNMYDQKKRKRKIKATNIDEDDKSKENGEKLEGENINYKAENIKDDYVAYIESVRKKLEQLGNSLLDDDDYEDIGNYSSVEDESSDD